MARFMREDRFVDGTLGAVSGLAYAGLEPSESLPMLRDFAFGLHRVIAKKQNKPVWASKTAADSFYIDDIEALCGNESRFVCITRHGADVACSVSDLMVKQEAYLPEMWEYIRSCPFPLEAFAKMWVDIATRMARFVKEHPENTLSIRYEDLAREPQPILDRIFAFAGVDAAPGLAETALTRTENFGPGDYKAYQKKVVDTAAVDRWRRLAPDTKTRLAAILNPTLEANGYEPMPIGRLMNAEQSRRRYLMGLTMQAMKRPE
jgi:hypothetical protein